MSAVTYFMVQNQPADPARVVHGRRYWRPPSGDPESTGLWHAETPWKVVLPLPWRDVVVTRQPSAGEEVRPQVSSW